MICLTEAGWLTIRRVLALLTGCWCNLVAGLALSLVVYTNAIKDTFVLNQTELEIVVSAFALGNGFSLLPGIIVDLYGSRTSSIIGTILYGLGSGLVVLSVTLPNFYLHKISLLASYFFLAGHGTSYLNMSAITVNSLNFDSRHRGSVVIILDIFYACSPIFYAPVYEYFYKNGHMKQASKQDLWGFSLFLLIFGLCASLSQVWFGVRVERSDSEEFISLTKNEHNASESTDTPKKQLDVTETKTEQHDQPELVKKSPASTNDYSKTVSLQQRLLRKLKYYGTNTRYHLVLWISCLVGAVANVVLGNATVFSRALRLSEKDMQLIVFPALFGVFFHGFIGPFSDKLRCRANRSAVWMVSNICICIGIILLVSFPAENYNGFIVILLNQCLGQAGQAGLIFLFVIITEKFKEKDCGKLIGIALLVQNLLGLLLQTSFGAIYDTQLDPGSTAGYNATTLAKKSLCYGNLCYRYGLIIDLVVVVIAVILNAVLIAYDTTEDDESLRDYDE